MNTLNPTATYLSSISRRFFSKKNKNFNDIDKQIERLSESFRKNNTGKIIGHNAKKINSDKHTNEEYTNPAEYLEFDKNDEWEFFDIQNNKQYVITMDTVISIPSIVIWCYLLHNNLLLILKSGITTAPVIKSLIFSSLGSYTSLNYFKRQLEEREEKVTAIYLKKDLKRVRLKTFYRNEEVEISDIKFKSGDKYESKDIVYFNNLEFEALGKNYSMSFMGILKETSQLMNLFYGKPIDREDDEFSSEEENEDSDDDNLAMFRKKNKDE